MPPSVVPPIDSGDATMPNHVAQTLPPFGDAFRQQKLKVWHSTYSLHALAITFGLLMCISIPIGVAVIVAYVQTPEVVIPYSPYQNCSFGLNILSTTNGAPLGCPLLTVNFTINQTIPKPVLMFYELDNFYQNFRAYAKSRSDTQLQGGVAQSSECDSFYSYENYTIHPCGAIAWSMFNDTFQLYRNGNTTSTTTSANGAVTRDVVVDRTLLCDTQSFAVNDPIGVNLNTRCRKKGIAWASDVSGRFMPAPALTTGSTIVTYKGIAPTSNATVNSNVFLTNGWYNNEPGHSIPNPIDEDFIVWMRLETTSLFRKNLRYLDEDLTPGNYTLFVTQRFPMSEFGGIKSIGFTSAPWYGTRYITMGILNLIIAVLSFVWFVLFFVSYVRKRMQEKEQQQKVQNG